MIKRAFDLVVSFILIMFFTPVFFIIAIVIIVDSGFPVFFLQQRIGLNKSPFRIIKFRTMIPGSESSGQITIGNNDSRITSPGKLLRKYKLDELPQLFNVFLGTMSMVGPRPEVPAYVKMYNSAQCKVLTVKPGITDYASIIYSSENELLAKADDPQKEYINTVMPAKLQLNLKYIEEQSLFTDIKILFKTVFKILGAD
jgi:lipopolysaccharide/colanic/teichoic acid biosynthesis glycosyltransferase